MKEQGEVHVEGEGITDNWNKDFEQGLFLCKRLTE